MRYGVRVHTALKWLMMWGIGGLFCVIMDFRNLCEEEKFTEQLCNYYLLKNSTASNAKYRYFRTHVIWLTLKQSLPRDWFHVIRTDTSGSVAPPRLNIGPSVKFVKVNSFSSWHSDRGIEIRL
jgi:hypothetical protein